MPDWMSLFRWRSRPIEEPVAEPVRTVMFDPNKVHPAWAHGVGFELLGSGGGPVLAVGVDGVRSRIAAIRLAEGDAEADRLQAEFDGLLAIRARAEAGDGEADR